MGTEFMLRLAAKVARLIPAQPGETFEQYTARVRNEPVEGSRALVAACIVQVSEELKDEAKARRQQAKDAWISAAREAFAPGARDNCAVCAKYSYLTHAHHLYPLAQQYEDGVMAVDQRYVWLCPNHHALVHLLISRNELKSLQMGRPASFVDDLDDDELAAVLLILRGRDHPEFK